MQYNIVSEELHSHLIFANEWRNLLFKGVGCAWSCVTLNLHRQSLTLFKETHNWIYQCHILCQKLLYMFVRAGSAMETKMSVAWRNKNVFLPHVTILGGCSNRAILLPSVMLVPCLHLAWGSVIPQGERGKEVWKWNTNSLKNSSQAFSHIISAHIPMERA